MAEGRDCTLTGTRNILLDILAVSLVNRGDYFCLWLLCTEYRLSTGLDYHGNSVGVDTRLPTPYDRLRYRHSGQRTIARRHEIVDLHGDVVQFPTSISPVILGTPKNKQSPLSRGPRSHISTILYEQNY